MRRYLAIAMLFMLLLALFSACSVDQKNKTPQPNQSVKSFKPVLTTDEIAQKIFGTRATQSVTIEGGKLLTVVDYGNQSTLSVKKSVENKLKQLYKSCPDISNFDTQVKRNGFELIHYQYKRSNNQNSMGIELSDQGIKEITVSLVHESFSGVLKSVQNTDRGLSVSIDTKDQSVERINKELANFIHQTVENISAVTNFNIEVNNTNQQAGKTAVKKTFSIKYSGRHHIDWKHFDAQQLPKVVDQYVVK